MIAVLYPAFVFMPSVHFSLKWIGGELLSHPAWAHVAAFGVNKRAVQSLTKAASAFSLLPEIYEQYCFENKSVVFHKQQYDSKT